MRIEVVTPPADEPVSLQEAKAFLRVEHTADDTLIGTLVTAARRAVEQHLRRSLVTTVLRVTLDAREATPPFALPLGPVSAIGSLEAWDSDTDAYVAADASAYVLAQDRVTMSEEDDAAGWPAYDRYHDAVRVQYTAGYGAEEDVPGDVKLRILQLVASWYEDRATVGLMPAGPDPLLDPYVNFACG